jgi:hypothetical protein
MNYWSIIEHVSGVELFIQSRLWFDARAAGALAMGQELGRYVGPEEVAVTEMPADFVPEKPTTGHGALMGNRGEARP